MTEYKKPLPIITDVNRPFWEAAKRHELRVPKCRECGNIHFPPGGMCPKCLSVDLDWVKLSGKGKVWSWVVFHQVFFKSFADDAPYNVAFVELDEGPVMITNLVKIRNEDIKLGMPVKVVFEDVTDTITLPKFEPSLSIRGDRE